MKTQESHPIGKLELMAYLDGELPRERAAAAASHLEQCGDCQALADDLRGVSREMSAWQVGSSELEINARIAVALEDHVKALEAAPKKRRPGWRLRGRMRGWVFAGAGVSALLVAGILMRSPRYSMMTADYEPRSQVTDGRVTRQEAQQPLAEETIPTASMAKIPSAPRLPAPQARPLQPRGLILPVGPMVIRTGELALTTTDFEQTRSKLEFILKSHNGYLADLTVTGSAETARTLTATLRVPANQLDATIVELKALGHVDSESQRGEEVSQRYVDLQARLANARNAELRLTDILRNRTGALADVLEVEQEIDRVRENIETMEAEKKNMENQVAFSALNMRIAEDFKQHVHADSTSTRIRNAAVDGYETMVAGLINLLMFLVSAGPSILLWGAILFFPARWAWKKWRKRNQI